MSLEVRVLHLGEVEVPWDLIVWQYRKGEKVRTPIHAFLILGGSKTILVDTGIRDLDVLAAMNVPGFQTPEQTLPEQLRRHGVRPQDIDLVVHTHLHLDHAGRDSDFPRADIVLQRRELEFAVSGLMHPQYPEQDIAYLLSRLHQGKGLLLLDSDVTGDAEIVPGVRCALARGHTEGSQNIYVETGRGTAVLCGDVVYNIRAQTVERPNWPSGNTSQSLRDERAAIARVVRDADFLLPSHDGMHYGETIPPP